MTDKKRCAYCGATSARLEREHVVPSCLYRASRTTSRVQRMTVPSCTSCNRGYSDDEAHFRNVLLVAGEPNAAVRELWTKKAWPSFDEKDGQRRLRDLVERMVPVSVEGNDRWMIYPGHDERVVRILRKIVRGLCHHHGLESAVAERRVWADVLKYQIPEELTGSIALHHRELDVFQYSYVTYDEGELSSAWILRFFERRTFVAAVEREPSAEA